MDWSAFFAGAALLLAVASPIFTSIIQATAAKKTRDDEFYSQHKAEIIEKYASSACRMMYWVDQHSRDEYSKSFGELLLIVPDDLREKLKEFDQIVTSDEWPDGEPPKDLFFDICSDLAEHSPRIKKDK